MLSSEVINDLDRKITMDDLDPTVIADLNDSVTDGSIGLSKLSSEVSNALKPVVIGQPSSVVGVGGATASLSVGATGGDNSYQWKKNGLDVVGASNKILTILDLNASQHEGNYTAVVSNAFGSVTSSVAQIDVNGSLTDGLVGWWKFDEIDGSIAYDSSGNGNDGNLTNGPTWTEGKIGGALSFDGVDDYVNLGNVLSSSYTKVAWVKKTDTGNGNILSFDDSHALWIKSTGYLAVKHFYSGSVELEDDKLFSINQWMHVCSTYEANTQEMSLLKNGSVIMSTSNVQELGSNIQVFAGKFKNVNSWTGLLDDVRIYDRALSAVEVKALYELGEQPVQESGSGMTRVVDGTVADGSITTNQLSEQILKYLKPEITQQPIAGTIYADTNSTISVSAEGKYLTYQWKKNGVNLTGETNATLTITDANATQHDGNYSVVVSNDFGSVESELASIVVPGYNLTDGLVAWWKFDGNTNDSSGNNLNGSNQGASLTTDKNGESGKAYSFNNSHISVAHSNLLNFTDSFSISLWVFSTNYITNDWQEFLMKGSVNNLYRQYHIRPNKDSGKLAFIFYQSGTAFSSTSNTALENNKWSHVVGTLSNSQVNLYINGLKDSSRQFNNFSSVTSTTYSLSVGRLGTYGGYYFNGKIDEVRMYDRALSASDVQALYQLGQ
jgi:hypothetical protein